MRQLSLIAAVILFVAFAACARAYGAEKPKRPVVCLSYALAKTDQGTVAVCYDNKRPQLLSRFQEVSLQGETGVVKALVGWR